MVDISASMVKELRDRSGAAMMDCKRALVEAQGDFEKAFEVLRQKGIAVAQKKAARTASEGLVVGKVSDNGKIGALAEVNCETDFVARNPEFIELTGHIIDLALTSKAKDVDALLAVKSGSGTLNEVMTEKVAKTGENMIVRRLAVFELAQAHGVVGLYLHALGGKMGAIVEISASKELPAAELAALGKEIAMHTVSAKPAFISRDQIPADVVENERRIESGKADLAEKKAEIKDKIIQGRIDKLLAERCLLDQPFVKDPSQTIAQYLAQKGKALGAELKPTRFSLFILGEVAGDTNGNEE